MSPTGRPVIDIKPRCGGMRFDRSRITRHDHHGFFVTGTDTGVGKTLVACALAEGVCRARAEGGRHEAGCERRRRRARTASCNDDVERLIAAGNVAAPREHVNPYCFAPPIAPHIAARRGRRHDRSRSHRALLPRARRARRTWWSWKGVGGFRVPLGPGADTAQLAARLALPVVLVVGVRLGCLNHALLTAEAIAAPRPHARRLGRQSRRSADGCGGRERAGARSAHRRAAARAHRVHRKPRSRGHRGACWTPANCCDARRAQLAAYVEVFARSFGCLAPGACDTFHTLDAECRRRKTMTAGTDCSDQSHATEFKRVARRNNSLSSTGTASRLRFHLRRFGRHRRRVRDFGAWLILPFAGLEMLVLYLAFRYIDRQPRITSASRSRDR